MNEKQNQELSAVPALIADTKQEKKPKHLWKKGQSGNPGGKKPKTEEERTAEQLARTHAPEAIKALVDIAKRGVNENARVKASEAILDRGFGRPRETVDMNVANQTPRQMTDGDIIATLARYGVIVGGPEQGQSAQGNIKPH